MKTRKDTLQNSRATKKPRLTSKSAFDILPKEIWLEIFKVLDLDKRIALRLAKTCLGFYELVNERQLYDTLPWPDVDYRLYFTAKNSYLYFKPQPGYFYNDAERYLFILANGDVGIGLPSGEVFLLRYDKSTWINLGRHKNKVDSLISINTDTILSCGKDGILVWSGESGRQIQHLPHPNSENAKGKLNKLLPFSYNCFISSWKGQVHIWQLESGSNQFQLLCQLSADEDSKNLKDLFLMEEFIVGIYNDCILRWDKAGNVVDRIELVQLEDKLAAFLGRTVYVAGQILFENRLPNGYIFVTFASTKLIINLFDLNITFCELGHIANVKLLAQTNNNDLIVFTRDSHGDAEVRAGWDQKENKFAIFRPISPFHHYRILTNGSILNENLDVDNVVTIYDPYLDQSRELTLSLPRGVEEYSILSSMKNGDILGKCSSHYLIWDAETGQCKLKIEWDGGSRLKETASGDLLQFFHGLVVGRSDYIKVHRFGSRK